jgi:hypothetical protein
VNFGRGGLKKVVDDEDARHVEAMHSASIAGICIRRENLKPIKFGVGFWPMVFKCEKKGKLYSKDLEIVDRNVRQVTQWSDLVDDKTSFVEVVCENYEALVRENRKKISEDGLGDQTQGMQ